MTKAAVKRLLKKVDEADDKLSEAVTALWKAVDPTPEEIEGVRDALAQRDDVYDPTDLQVLRRVIDGREP